MLWNAVMGARCEKRPDTPPRPRLQPSGLDWKIHLSSHTDFHYLLAWWPTVVPREAPLGPSAYWDFANSSLDLGQIVGLG